MADETEETASELEKCEACQGSGNPTLGGYCDLCHNEGTVKPEVNAAYQASRGY